MCPPSLPVVPPTPGARRARMCAMATSPSTPARPQYRAPMTNERLVGHVVAAVCALLALVVIAPLDTATGWVPALVGCVALVGVLGVNAAAVLLRSHTHSTRWAVANATGVALAFLGAVLALDAGRDFPLPPTPNLWLQLFIALMTGSVLVAKDRGPTPRTPRSGPARR